MLEVSDLKTYYYVDAGVLKAVDGVSFTLTRGESLGIAGESGCGKSTAALSILRLIKPPGRIIAGKVIFEGKDILSLDLNDLRNIRWSQISIIFQSAMSSFNPVYKIGEQIIEAIMSHQTSTKKEAKATALALLESVKLESSTFYKYPHELSGGMLQRAFIAMALACNPKTLIADEPTTALDVVNQAYVLLTLKNLQRERDLSLIIISHDLSILAQLCDNLLIMYAGKLVEYANAETIFEKPAHPYTVGLMGSFPSIKGPQKKLTGLPGTPPNLINPPRNCLFSPRCPHAETLCYKEEPRLERLESGHYVACHFAEALR